MLLAHLGCQMNVTHVTYATRKRSKQQWSSECQLTLRQPHGKVRRFKNTGHHWTQRTHRTSEIATPKSLKSPQPQFQAIKIQQLRSLRITKTAKLQAQKPQPISADLSRWPSGPTVVWLVQYNFCMTCMWLVYDLEHLSSDSIALYGAVSSQLLSAVQTTNMFFFEHAQIISHIYFYTLKLQKSARCCEIVRSRQSRHEVTFC